MIAILRKTLFLGLFAASAALSADTEADGNFSTHPDILKLREEISLLKTQVTQTQMERAELTTRLVDLEISIKALFDKIEVLSGVELQEGE